MRNRENTVLKYFSAWLNNDPSYLQDIFAQNIIYSECYGPEYRGLDQIFKWFSDWNTRGKVLVWDIKQFVHQGNITVAEWYFECGYDQKISGFDGVSIIEFKDDKIIALREFQSNSKHIYSYGTE